MSDDETPIRLRVHPEAAPKSVPKRCSDWPDCALVFHSLLDAEAALALGCLLELVQFWPVTEALVGPDHEADGEMLNYSTSHRANTIAGARRDIELVPRRLQRIGDRSDGLGYRLRDRGYRKGWAIVCADAARQLVGMVDHWSRSRSTPNAWSLVLPGLSRVVTEAGQERLVAFRDAPRMIITPVGTDQLVGWGTTSTEGTEDGDESMSRHRPPPKRGPIVDVLRVARALKGNPDISTVADACEVFGVTRPSAVPHAIDLLREEALGVARLYQAEVRFAEQLDLGLDLSNLVSTGGIGTALLREAGVRP